MPPKKTTTTKTSTKSTKKTVTKTPKAKPPSKATNAGIEKMWDEAFRRYYYEALQRIEDDNGLEGEYDRNVYVSYSSIKGERIIPANPQNRFTVSVGARYQLAQLWTKFVELINQVADKSTVDSIKSELTFDAPLTLVFEVEPPKVPVDVNLEATCIGHLNAINIPPELAATITARYLTWIQYLAEKWALGNLTVKTTSFSIQDIGALLRMNDVDHPIVAATKYIAPPKKVKDSTTEVAKPAGETDNAEHAEGPEDGDGDAVDDGM